MQKPKSDHPPIDPIRGDALLRRALAMPHKPQAQSKVGRPLAAKPDVKDPTRKGRKR
jgi:hypothetical protein